jgi:hypothetical protein
MVAAKLPQFNFMAIEASEVSRYCGAENFKS